MRSSLAAAALALLALSACGKARRDASESAAATGLCTRCHGGVDNPSGAPPGALRGDLDTTVTAVGAHSAHVQAGALAGPFACTACHPDPRSGSTHLDGTVELDLGGFAHEASGSGAVPAFDRASGTCASVYCHGAFRGGNGGNAPVWTRVGEAQAACGSCHGAPPPAPHPPSSDCGRCHAGYSAGSVNLATHVNGKVDLDGLACTSCHGDPARAKNGAAPPLGTRGETATTERAVGAHQAHLAGATLGSPIACDACHVVPTSLAHADGAVDLRFGPLATAGGTFTASFDGATCTTYCHGATLQAGGARTTPSWTGGAGEAACGSCHGVPPPAPHPPVASLEGCTVCHPQTVNAAGGLIPASAGGKHLDGTLQSAGHDASWMDPASPGFHALAADADLASCTGCHGAELDGGPVQIACASCHDASLPAGVASWRQNCTMCHGGGDNLTGAPPRTIWGRGSEAVRVGAHTTHVSGSALAPAIGCGACHVKPADALSPGHADGPTATVTFGGIAVTGTAVPPVWDRATATCAATYCHGGTMQGGTNTRPVWTSVGAGEASCGSCHGVPPPAPHPAVSGLTSCAACHPDTMDAAGAVIAPASGGKHLDGVLEVASSHDASWMDRASPGFHAYSADRGLAACQTCHGQRLDALPGGNCASCHGGSAWSTNCTMCHGDPARTANAAAPPRAIWGQGGDPVRVGAHSAHLPLGCAVCHAVPTDALAGHVDRGTATVTFGGLAVPPGSNVVPNWDRTTATCSSTYCHGATLSGGSNTAPVWTGGASQAACGSCHGTPPPDPHPAVSGELTGCAICHNGTVTTAGTLIPASSGGKHLNGAVDSGSLEAGCSSCHALPPDDGGTNGHRFHVSTVRVDCGTCHAGYSRTTADPAFHMNGRRDARLVYPTPNPDPGPGNPPTLEACLAAPLSAIGTIPQSTSTTTWDTDVCSTCHRLRDYRYNACCNVPGAPVPDWCATWW